MIVKRETNYASCNFCKRGELSGNGKGLIYPYDSVIEFKADKGGIQASICDDCMNELIVKYEMMADGLDTPPLLCNTRKG